MYVRLNKITSPVQLLKKMWLLKIFKMTVCGSHISKTAALDEYLYIH